MNNHSNKIIEVFDEIFNEKNCHELCRKYKFIQRSSSKLRGDEFIKTMILPSKGLSTDSLKGLCSRMKELNPKANLTAQALCEKINDISSSRLMQGVFTQLLLHAQAYMVKDCPKLAEVSKDFNRVLIQDSTVMELNERLQDEYEGTNRGGNGSKSQVKIDIIHDIMKGLVVDAKIYNGNENDQSFATRILKYITPGDLIIRDLGYFVLDSLNAIVKANAYFLSRLLPNVHFYLNAEDKEPLDLGKHLEKYYSNFNVIELEGFLGKAKIPTRLIIYRQLEEVTNKRLREAYKGRKSRNMSKGKKLCLQFSIFVTNVSAEILAAKLVGTIYRLRWSIELLFKKWKSQLEVDYLKGIHKDRIDCLIWSRLCTAVIIEMITHHVASIAPKWPEISEVKLIDYLMRNNIFCNAVAKYKLEDFFEKMREDIPRMLLKDKRIRKTMRERAFSMESYYGIQDIENQMVA
jgi:hypothetical protein